MKLKRILASLLAVALLTSCLALVTNAASPKIEPTVLYVGEKNKSEDNLIQKYDESNDDVYVVKLDAYTSSYYTLQKDKDTGVYILTFYNNYTMSEIVNSNSGYCGLYCDGDLYVRINGNVTFDADSSIYKSAYGWIVEGTLTIEGVRRSDASLTVSGSKTKYMYSEGSIGIYAKTLMLHNVTVNATGGYAAVAVDETIVMAGATLNANTGADMKLDGRPLFKNSIEAKDFIQSGGVLRAAGTVDIGGFYAKSGEKYLDEEAVIYLKTYKFDKDEDYKDKWNKTCRLFKNQSDIPKCMDYGVNSTKKNVAVIDGNELKLNRRGEGTLTLTIQCGTELITLDTRPVECKILWWQWPLYILSFQWLDLDIDFNC